eukprot:TRINITY_DN19648_c0_g1_i1.p1 TRINITY_DN19648_c0_g1~~TRINITY_DN19648_c0_g1_i1.p1  ORF type:complete len:331 (-),score=71.73 TRINITY_DN19648_c0_g1_i1:253-1245(-)
MPIVAVLIAKPNPGGPRVLAEAAQGQVASFGSIARRLVEQVPTGYDSKKSYSHQAYNFHYVADSGLVYVCMSDQAMGYRLPYEFLFDVSKRFKMQYGDKVATAQPGAFEAFNRQLAERMDFFSNDRNADKINKVKGEIEDVKVTMVQNIEKVLARGEQIEVLVDKTEDLQHNATTFKRKSVQLKRKLWWKNAKLCVVLICIVLCLIAGAVVGLLFWLRPSVFHGSSSSGNSGDTPPASTSTTSTSSTTTTSTSSSTSTSSASLLLEFAAVAEDAGVSAKPPSHDADDPSPPAAVALPLRLDVLAVQDSPTPAPGPRPLGLPPVVYVPPAA